MISVGIRLPDNVFPSPEEPIAKLRTSENPEMYKNGIDENGVARINRIVLSRTSIVSLLRVESPSRIWVRLQNHITDSQLTFTEPFELVKKANIVVGDYALAPCDERAFRRCRITEIGRDHEGNEVVKIFFIDDAVAAWVEPGCLAEMKEHYMFFPWQAIQVSMFGIYPAMQDLTDTEQKWSEETCDELAKILNEFQLLQIEVILSSIVNNDYAKPTPVHLNGIKNDDNSESQQRSTVSISDILLKTLPNSVIIVPNHDGAGHELFGTNEIELPTRAHEIHKRFPADWKMKSVCVEQANEEAERLHGSLELEHRDWDPRQNSIPMLTIQDLKDKFVFPEKINRSDHIMMAVEGRCTKSPFEWYARPIIKTMKNILDEVVPWNDDSENLRETDKVDWMIYGNDQLLSVAEQLDTYYSNPKNRKPLKSEEIKRMREEGREVFAVCAVNEEKATYTGEWQRVLILDCEDFAEVRFLDSGGRDMVLTSSLYRIHRQHCRFPSMCLQLCLHGVSTRINRIRPDKKWNVKETSMFKICLREDVPIFIDVNDLAHLIPHTARIQRPYMTKNVILARDVKYLGETKSLVDRFVGNGQGCAEPSEMDPVCWPASNNMV